MFFFGAVLTLSGCQLIRQSSEADELVQSEQQASHPELSGEMLLDGQHYQLVLTKQPAGASFFLSGRELCFEQNPTQSELAELEFIVLKKQSGGTREVNGTLLSGAFAEKGCLLFEKIVSSQQIIFSLRTGDGLASTKEYFSLAGTQSESLYLVRSWETMDDEGVVEYTAWVVANRYFLQAKAGKDGGSVFRGANPSISSGHFMLEPEGEVVLQTNQPLEFNALDERNINGYKNGLTFKHAGQDITLGWE